MNMEIDLMVFKKVIRDALLVSGYEVTTSSVVVGEPDEGLIHIEFSFWVRAPSIDRVP
jgi:hypothetical protein